MPKQPFDARDAKNTKLHIAIARVEHELARLTPSALAEGNTILAGLRRSWEELVNVLALDPVLELRECPGCKHICTREATRCGTCWAELPRVAADEPRPSRVIENLNDDGSIVRSND